MPVISELRDDIKKYLQRHGLFQKWEKAKKLFENDPSHPSLNTELLEPRHRLIYSFSLSLGSDRGNFQTPIEPLVIILFAFNLLS